MAKNLNRKKIFFLSKGYLLFFFLTLVCVMLFLMIYSNKYLFFEKYKNTIEKLSKDFDYQYSNFEVNELENVTYEYLENKLKKYKNISIFLLPLDKIGNDLKENPWIKNIKLSTNYRNTLFINLEEYKPIGLYSFSNKLFFFNKEGSIIDELNKKNNLDNSLYIFLGQSSNLNASTIIDILNNLNFQNKYNIKSINYINKRRWDIILNNNIKLMLSENSPEISLQNFINIEKNLSKADMNNIEYFDLRNIEKTLITYNE